MGKERVDQKERWFRPEPCWDTREALGALAVEARRRGITYGQLMGLTSGYERQEIIRAYRMERGRKDHRRG